MKSAVALFCLLAFFLPFTHADVSTGLIAYYRIDENTGREVADSSSNDYNATYTNSSQRWVGGYTNAALDFNNTAGGLLTSFDVNARLNTGDLNNSPMTISFWSYQTGEEQQGHHLYSATDSGSQRFYLEQFRFSGASVARLGLGSWNPTPVVLNLNTWVHIVIVLDGNSGYVYKDRVLNVSTTNIVVSYPSQKLRIGCGFQNCATSDTNGIIDEFRIYNRALSTADINQLYYCQPPTLASTDWIIDGNTDCSMQDINAVINTAIGGHLNIKSGTLSIENNRKLIVPAQKKIYLRKNSTGRGKILLKRGGRVLGRK